MSLWQWIESADTRLFSFIHSEGAVPALDWFVLLLRNAFTWIPLYAFMLYWIFRYGKQYALSFILLTVITFAITDYVSASILKPWLSRIRPCYEDELQPILRGLVGCGGQYSLPSNHAANHFGLAAFWFWSIYLIRGKKWHWLWFWALIICYAQVYVGKHYPLDVVAGGLFGSMVGLLCAKIFERWQFPGRHRPYYHHKPLPGFN